MLDQIIIGVKAKMATGVSLGKRIGGTE